ncbi:DUF4382 domain-containing protein [Hymenobacter aquaticus]|uniref:DUF4382 domain-containing protein n=1 Tax=Hymenobacter aquaticus TaxID=1867101 RepID=A0A4Z0PVC5_9BACT|nr:DUF4382 domain-containing protein [Hymenobacter aquaticus]TGE21249.1 DUF4382 domain-containing protein [Hymenobacter aquaticus]
MKTYLLFSGLLTSAVLLTGCEDALQEAAPATQTAAQDAKKEKEPKLTYQAVNVDVQRVEVSQDADESTSHWATLTDVQPGMRNLLASSTLASPLFTTAGFQAGTVKQIRLILGANNTITLSNGRVVALDTPSGQTSGLKVKVNRLITGGQQYAVLVGIDPEWQVVAKGNGSYGLKPVLEGYIATILSGGGGGGETELRAQR